MIGSTVRAENRDDSDEDFFVELTRDLADDFFASAGVARDLEEIVGRDVDVARSDRLRTACASKRRDRRCMPSDVPSEPRTGRRRFTCSPSARERKLR